MNFFFLNEIGLKEVERAGSFGKLLNMETIWQKAGWPIKTHQSIL